MCIVLCSTLYETHAGQAFLSPLELGLILQYSRQCENDVRELCRFVSIFKMENHFQIDVFLHIALQPFSYVKFTFKYSEKGGH